MKLRYTPEPRRDLRRIKAFKLKNGGDPDKATTSISKACSGLKGTPDIGVSARERYGVDTDMDVLFHEIYAIFYRITDDYVEIIRIFDTREDIMFHMFGIDETTDSEE